MTRPCVFIGSSGEGLEIARKVRSQITDLAEVTMWNEGPFGLSEGFLDSLVRAAHRFDFAILVLTRDDLLTSRGETVQVPRDNVLFECGLFIGRLGAGRTFLVYDMDNPPKLPTDLAGISMACFRGARSDGNLMAAVGSACDAIRDAIRALGARSDTATTEISVGPERLHILRDPDGWLRPVQLRVTEAGVSTRLGSTALNVTHGRIEDTRVTDGAVLVLPANEYFDDDCVNDRRSALGAFVQTHFAGRVGELQQLVRMELGSLSTTSVEKRSGETALSYGIGTCVFLDRPLGSDHRLILTAVTTERSGIGLRAEIPFLLAALKEMVCTMRTHRLSHVYMPLLGAGHGGLREEVALFTMILGLSEIAQSVGRNLKSANIVLYRDSRADRPSVPTSVVRQIVLTAVGLSS